MHVPSRSRLLLPGRHTAPGRSSRGPSMGSQHCTREAQSAARGKLYETCQHYASIGLWYSTSLCETLPSVAAIARCKMPWQCTKPLGIIGPLTRVADLTKLIWSALRATHRSKLLMHNMPTAILRHADENGGSRLSEFLQDPTRSTLVSGCCNVEFVHGRPHSSARSPAGIRILLNWLPFQHPQPLPT